MSAFEQTRNPRIGEHRRASIERLSSHRGGSKSATQEALCQGMTSVVPKVHQN